MATPLNTNCEPTLICSYRELRDFVNLESGALDRSATLTLWLTLFCAI